MFCFLFLVASFLFLIKVVCFLFNLLGNVRFGIFAWELSLGISGWRSRAPVIGGTAGRQLGELGSCEWGNRWTGAGGTLAGQLHPLPFKKLYKNRLEIPEGIPS